MSEAAEGDFFEEVLAEGEGCHDNHLFAGGGEEGLGGGDSGARLS